MTDPRDLSPDDEAEALAAEYVLGVLSLEDRLTAEARAKSDAAFAACVERWETHFEALNDSFSSVPAPDMMPQIEARIFGKPADAKRSWWGFLVGAAAAATIVVFGLMLASPFLGNGEVLTANITADAQELAFNASYSDGTLTLTRLSGPDADVGRDYELWLIVGDAAPKSLGLVKDANTTLALDTLAPGSVLAVSLEPAGGSTTGSPTGPVLITGVIAAT